MLGALMVVPGPLRAGGADVRDPRQRPHDPGCPRRDRPLDRALERAGPPLWGVHRDHPQGAQTRGAADCQDPSSRPHKLPWTAPEEERAIVCAFGVRPAFPWMISRLGSPTFCPILTATRSTAS